MTGTQTARPIGAVRSFLLVLVCSILAGAVMGLAAGLVVRGLGGGGTGSPGSPGSPGDASGEASQPDPVRDDAATPGNPYAGFRVAEFRLLDQDGISVDESLLDGRVTALAFFFTSCNGPCPEMARVMRQIQDKTVGTGLRLMSISVDGQRDTPAVIRSFAESYGADPTRWRFLTGSPEVVRELVSKSIGFELREQADVQVEAPDGGLMNNILHPTRLLLVGPDRRLIGVYWYTDPAQIEKLIEDAADALG